MIYVLLAEGFEEIEAVAPIDILRRAEIPVVTVGVGGKTITGAHGIPIVCDDVAGNADCSKMSGIVLPGGLKGSHNLEDSFEVQSLLDCAARDGKLISAICAAPFVLGKKGLLKGKRATCYPGFEKDLHGAFPTGEDVCRDGNIITGKAAGVAVEFALEIAAFFKGEECANKIRSSIHCR
ncbi:MAG: DJ-1/PfpI family protein [Clostridiales bacterium]|nr:DJ-1/PfpI family protein [Clostridiales bacterium]